MASSRRIASTRTSELSQEKALEAARNFVRAWLDVTPCTKPPDPLYGFDSEVEFLFEVRRDGPLAYVGASIFLAVCIKTGVVRVAGTAGE